MAGELALLDWRRRVAELYAEVRAAANPRAGWERWRTARDELFRSHPCSPVPADARAAFPGIPLYDYDSAARVEATVRPVERLELELPALDGARYGFTRFAMAEFELAGAPRALDLHWLRGYAGGVFLAFADATNGAATYGGGRYLLDTIKGADLGGGPTLDFNFAYNPSCSYDPAWSCPLPRGVNRLECAVQAGELAPAGVV